MTVDQRIRKSKKAKKANMDIKKANKNMEVFRILPYMISKAESRSKWIRRGL